MSKLTIYRSTIINPLNDKKCDFIKDGALVVNEKNKIFAMGKYKDLSRKYPKAQTVIFSDSVLLPPFFDMHFHWVQDDVRQMPKDLLLEWLDKYTFPAEMKFKDNNYAENYAEVFFKKLTKMGTLGGACYSSIHGHALEAAQKNAVGDFVIGNVLMNMNSPAELTQTKKESIALVKKFIAKYKKKYALTPRFAISTDPDVMIQTSKLAKKAKIFMQTHLSENPNEISFVKELYRGFKGFEKIKSYTEIYQKVGMLSSRTIMGHGIHLDEAELKLLSKTKTIIAHCPTSNAPINELGLGSGLFDFKKIEKYKVRWALASDIGGGPFLSMFDVIESFVAQNNRANIKGATYTKAFYRATLAGAEILGLAKKVGNFKKGKEANFIVAPCPGAVKFLSAEKLLKELISTKRRDDYEHMLSHVFYQGRSILK